MALQGVLSNAASTVSAAAQAFGTTVTEHAGHLWTWLSTNIPAAYHSVCASITAAWAAAGPAASSFGTWVGTYQTHVAVVIAITVIATLATRAICQRL